LSRRRRRYNRYTFPDDAEHGTPVALPEDEARPLLQTGEIVSGYRLPWGSNYTFYVRISAGPGKFLRAIYKPRDGERPLWDFPSGSLYKREYATYVLSRCLGWPSVPLTLVREGPYGVGTVQLYVDHDPETNYFDLVEDKAEQLQKFAIFDLLVNNADRKAGHCLLDPHGTVWSIDHGLTFHPSFKLRTVMLEFWGKPMPDDLVRDIEALGRDLETAGDVSSRLAEMLSPVEVGALLSRVGFLLEEKSLPALDPYFNVPWPWV
jgi:uncharacterized repeat protein (TIGR03843 family)